MAQAEARGREERQDGQTGDAAPGVGVRKDGSTHDSVTGEILFGAKTDPEFMAKFIKTIRVELNKDIKSTLADALEGSGFFAEAAKLKGTKVEVNIFSRVWHTRVTAGHALIGVGATGALWLIYEGVAYALKDKYKLPSLLRKQEAPMTMRRR